MVEESDFDSKASAPVVVDRNANIRSALDKVGQVFPPDIAHLLIQNLKLNVYDQDVLTPMALKTMLLEQDAAGDTLLMALLQRKDEIMSACIDGVLELMDTLGLSSQVAILKIKNQAGQDAFLLALESGHKIEPLFERIQSLPAGEPRALLTHPNHLNTIALMRPSMLDSWLAHIQSLDNQDNPILFTSLRGVFLGDCSLSVLSRLMPLVRQFSIERQKAIYSRMKELDRMKVIRISQVDITTHRQVRLLHLAGSSQSSQLIGHLQENIDATDKLPADAPIDALYALQSEWDKLCSRENQLMSINPARALIEARWEGMKASLGPKYVKKNTTVEDILHYFGHRNDVVPDKILEFKAHIYALEILPISLQANIIMRTLGNLLNSQWNDEKFDALWDRIDSFDTGFSARFLAQRSTDGFNALMLAQKRGDAARVQQLMDKIKALDDFAQMAILKPFKEKFPDEWAALKGGDPDVFERYKQQGIAACRTIIQSGCMENRALLQTLPLLVGAVDNRIILDYLKLVRDAAVADGNPDLLRALWDIHQAIGPDVHYVNLPLPQATPPKPVIVVKPLAERLMDTSYWETSTYSLSMSARIRELLQCSVADREQILPAVAKTIVSNGSPLEWEDFADKKALDANAVLTGLMLSRCLSDSPLKKKLDKTMLSMATSEALWTYTTAYPVVPAKAGNPAQHDPKIALIHLLLLLPHNDASDLMTQFKEKISASSAEIIQCLKSSTVSGEMAIDIHTALDLLFLLPYAQMQDVLNANGLLKQKINEFLKDEQYASLLSPAEKVPEIGTVPLFKALFLQEPAQLQKMLEPTSKLATRIAGLFTYDQWFIAEVDPMVQMTTINLRAMANWYIFIKSANSIEKAPYFEELCKIYPFSREREKVPEGRMRVPSDGTHPLEEDDLAHTDIHDACALLFALPTSHRQRLLSAPGRLPSIANQIPLNADVWMALLNQAHASLDGLEVFVAFLNALDAPKREELLSLGTSPDRMEDRIQQCMVNRGLLIGRDDAPRYWGLLFMLNEQERLSILRAVGPHLVDVAPNLPYFSGWVDYAKQHYALADALQNIKQVKVPDQLKKYTFFRDLEAGIFDPPNGLSNAQFFALLMDDALLVQIFSEPNESLHKAILTRMQWLDEPMKRMLLSQSNAEGFTTLMMAASKASVFQFKALVNMISSLDNAGDIFTAHVGDETAFSMTFTKMNFEKVHLLLDATPKSHVLGLFPDRMMFGSDINNVRSQTQDPLLEKVIQIINQAEAEPKDIVKKKQALLLSAGIDNVDYPWSGSERLFSLCLSLKDPVFNEKILRKCCESQHFNGYDLRNTLIQTLDIDKQAWIFDRKVGNGYWNKHSAIKPPFLLMMQLASQVMKLKKKADASHDAHDEKNYTEALHLYTILSQSIDPWTETPTKATVTFDYDVTRALSRAEGHFTRHSTMKTLVGELVKLNLPVLLSPDQSPAIAPAIMVASAPPAVESYEISDAEEALLLSLDDEEPLPAPKKEWFRPLDIWQTPVAEPVVSDALQEAFDGLNPTKENESTPKKELDQETAQKLLKNLSNPKSSLFQMAVSHPDSNGLEALLAFIEQQTPAIQARILMPSSPNQMSKLMMVALTKPSVLPRFLNIMESGNRAEPTLKSSILKHAFKSDNALTVALLNPDGQPKSIEHLLASMKTLAPLEQAFIFKQVRDSSKVSKRIADLVNKHPSIRRDFYCLELAAKVADYEAQSRGWWLSSGQKKRYKDASYVMHNLHVELFQCKPPEESVRQLGAANHQLHGINEALKKNSSFFLSSYLDLKSITGALLLPALTASSGDLKPAMVDVAPVAETVPHSRFVNADGDNLLMQAIKNGRTIDHLINPNLLTELNHQGQTALRIAIEQNSSVLGVLLSAVMALNATARKAILHDETTLLNNMPPDLRLREALLLLELERIYLNHPQDQALGALHQTLYKEWLTFQQQKSPNQAASMQHEHQWSSAMRVAEKAFTPSQSLYSRFFYPKPGPDFSQLGADQGAVKALFQQLNQGPFVKPKPDTLAQR